MAQRRVTTLPHRDRQYPKPRPHRKILMLVQRLAPAWRLVMNAARRRHVKHSPTPTQTIPKIEILARRAPREERRKATNRFERLSPQSTDAAANPLAGHRLGRSVWKAIRQRCANQLARVKSFDS